MNRYQKADLTHGHVDVENVEGTWIFFDVFIKGPAITHIIQVPPIFWALILLSIGETDKYRAEKGCVDPPKVPVDQTGILKTDWIPVDLGVETLVLKNKDADESRIMKIKKLQNGHLKMLAAAVFLVQEAIYGQGIIEHLQSM